jgi:hypothetical protein
MTKRSSTRRTRRRIRKKTRIDRRDPEAGQERSRSSTRICNQTVWAATSPATIQASKVTNKAKKTTDMFLFDIWSNE